MRAIAIILAIEWTESEYINPETPRVNRAI